MEARIARRHGPLHWLFEGGIALKGLMGIIEAALGLGLLLTPSPHLHRLIDRAAQRELIEDRHSRMWQHLLARAQAFPASSQQFYATYLLLHGVMKLVMVGLLWGRLAFAYPAAMAIQCGFIAFEMHRWAETRNPVLLGLALLDGAIILLIWHEWRGKA